MREHIEGLIRSGAAAEAAQGLAAYWSRERSPAAAHFVVSGFESLAPSLRLVDCRLSILRSFTVEPLIPLLQAAAFGAGIHLRVQVGDFNAYAQEILDPASRLYSFRPDVVILAVHTLDIAPHLWQDYSPSVARRRDDLIQEVSNTFQRWIQTFRGYSPAHLIVHNLQIPPHASSGIVDCQALDSQHEAIRQINHNLRRIAKEYQGVYLLDYDALVARHGRCHWSDERKWTTMRLPIAAGTLRFMCEEWVRFLHPLTGKIAKAVAVDLDNTLWGGVIGEDGIAGIQLGPGYPGTAYLEVQRALRDLHHRGILLAIASKNNAEDALEVLAHHPEMLLRREHFAATRINWQDKAQSLREIAEELNIGLESLALVDDNPVERHQVALALPEITIVDLPEDPFAYAQAIRDCPAFERLQLSEEDLKRGQYYSDQRQRIELQRASGSPQEFLRSLRQVVEIAPVTPMTLTRVAQLTQKTNQFNLTTRRYTEQQISELAAKEDMQVFSLRLQDIYNDNGHVGVSILRHQGQTCEIETFLLSCRVIGRTIETAFLAFICQQARLRRATTLKGWFLPTRKNAPAASLYPAHGFTLVDQTDTGRLFEFDLSRGDIACPEWIRLT